MPFGKHRGMPLCELPDSYLDWLLELPDLREPLKSRLLAEAESREVHAVNRTSALDLHVVDEVIRTGYKVLAKRRHPESGGSHEAMIQLSDAVDFLRRCARTA